MKWIILLPCLCFSSIDLGEVFYSQSDQEDRVYEVITLGKLEKYNRLDQVLETESDIYISGSLGAQQINAQGLPAQYQLILLNGYPLNDPSSISGSANLSMINFHSIERIEISRGVGAIIYGGGVSGIVINIITKQDLSNKLIVEEGYRRAISTGSGKAWEQTILSGSMFLARSDSLSAKASGKEIDSQQELGGEARLTHFINESEIELYLRRDYSNNEIDVFRDTLSDEAGFYNKNTVETAGLSFKGKRYILRQQYTAITREYRDLDFLGAAQLNEFNSQRLKTSLLINFENIKLGVEIEAIEVSDFSRTQSSTFIFWKNKSYRLGSRVDKYTSSQTKSSLYAGLSFYGLDFDITKTYRLPTAFELNAEFGGNKSLESEHISSAFVKKNFGPLNISGFFNQVENSISSVNGNYENEGELQTAGINTELEFEVGGLTFKQESTYLERKSVTSKKFPKQKHTLGIVYQVDKWNLTTNMRYVGQREVFGVKLAKYYATDIFLSKAISQAEELTLRGINIFKAAYEDAPNYSVLRGAFQLSYSLAW